MKTKKPITNSQKLRFAIQRHWENDITHVSFESAYDGIMGDIINNLPAVIEMLKSKNNTWLKQLYDF